MYLFWYRMRVEIRVTKPTLPEIPVRFYRTVAGREPVLDWLRTLEKENRLAIGLDLMRVQFAWPIGMPLVRSLKDGLWEVRSDLASERTARLLFCFHDEQLIVAMGSLRKLRRPIRQTWHWQRRE